MAINRRITTYLREYAGREASLLKVALEQRILPGFASTMSEAIAVADKEYVRLKEEYPDRVISYEDEAWEEGRNYYNEIMRVETTVINIIVVSLFHLFEQRLGEVWRNLNWSEASVDTNAPSLPQVVKLLLADGVDCSQFRCWSTINELRLVANLVKHGDGSSARQLMAVRPDLFPINAVGFTPMVGLPLTGDGYSVRHPQVAAYFDAVAEFWIELANAIDLAAPPEEKQRRRRL